MGADCRLPTPFHQTLLREWAYALQYASSDDARQEALPHWINHYHARRTHSVLGNRPPTHPRSGRHRAQRLDVENPVREVALERFVRLEVVNGESFRVVAAGRARNEPRKPLRCFAAQLDQ